jgi:glutamate synthase (NADPH/NADH) small chain
VGHAHARTTGDLGPPKIHAEDKRVIVIGGGDTGTDCIATAARQGAKSIVNFEIVDRPPDARAKDNPWPEWPRVFRVDYGHEEARALYGHDPRAFHVMTKAFVDDGHGHVAGVVTIEVEWSRADDGRLVMRELPGTERTWDADLVFLAMGFLGPESTLADKLHLARDARTNIAADYARFATNVPTVFTAGDCRRGQSLVVWAIAEGRGAARAIDAFLMGESDLPAPD